LFNIHNYISLVTSNNLGGKLGTLTGTPPLADQRTTGLLLLGESLRDNLLVRRRLFIIPQHTRQFRRLACPLALQHKRSDQTLNLGCFADGLSLLIGESAGNDVFGDIVILGQVEESANVVGALGPQTAGDGIVRQTSDRIIADLDHGEVEHGDILGHDAAADGLALALSGPALSVTLVALVHEETDAGVGEDALAHGEALLVVTAGNAEDVAGEFFAEDGAVDFLRHAAFVEVLEALFVIDFDDFLEARGGDGDIDLHGCRLLRVLQNGLENSLGLYCNKG